MFRSILITITFLFAAHCAQQPAQDPVKTIFNEIKEEITVAQSTKLLDDPQNPSEWDLPTFLDSIKAKEFRLKIRPLSLDQKNRLMNTIQVVFIECVNDRSEKKNWRPVRDFLALVVKEGGSIDTLIGTKYRKATFLGVSTLYSDFPAVTFAITNQSNVLIQNPAFSTLKYSLQLATDVRIAQLIISQGGLEPFKNDHTLQYDLLARCMQGKSPYQLLKLYKDQGLNLRVKNELKRTLLHDLIQSRFYWMDDTLQFFEKFLILYKNGAVDLDACDYYNKTVLDYIKAERQEKPVFLFARTLLEDLEKNPDVWKSQILSIEQAQGIKS